MQYVHGGIDRRGFSTARRSSPSAASPPAMLLDALSPQFAEAQQVPKDDKRIKTEYVEYRVAAGQRARCAATWRGRRTPTGKLPGVLVVHENRGLNPHIEDIARRLALDNFIAFAPDALAPLGGYPGDEDKARELFPKLDQAKTREDFVAAATWLKSAPGVHRQDRRGRLLLRRRHREHARRRACRISPPACRSTAASRQRRTWRRSRRRC